MEKKRLIICCDGTWDDADATADFTNVVRIARAIKPMDTRTGTAIPQIVYYHSGVGTGGDAFEHIIGGAIGFGLSRNVRDGYAFVANNYCEGDEIFLFGFSRGAYTARSIAGLIGWAGLIHKGDMDDFALLWEGYRLKDHPGHPDARLYFPNRHESVPIKGIGVWDTVGALGVPGHLGEMFTQFYQFHDTNLGPHVENAFQALAPADQKLLQVWFAGAHSNVGGGYDEHGLSDIALAWMAGQIEPLLEIDRAYLAARQDQRDGWGLGKIYDSATGFFGLRPKINRQALASAAGCEAVHQSVAVRFDTLSASRAPYKPPSLPNGPPTAKIAALNACEEALRWPAPHPDQTGRRTRENPSVLDRLLNDFRGGRAFSPA
ncbi:MAG TPA: DUF2235 domain-containing protein [Stellaceae bacterium]|nr:DUF2235 domain-containing protein [Stellaceae bacterium]